MELKLCESCRPVSSLKRQSQAASISKKIPHTSFFLLFQTAFLASGSDNLTTGLTSIFATL